VGSEQSSVVSFWNKYKKINIFILKICLLAILIYNLYTKFSGDEFGQTIQLFKEQFSWDKIYYLVFVILLTVLNWGFESYKYYLCVQGVEPISYWRAYKGILFGNAMNLILPASIGELTGRPMVLKEENRIAGSGVAYYVSIVQKVASPLVGIMFLLLAYKLKFLSDTTMTFLGITQAISHFILFIAVLDIAFWLVLFIYPEALIWLIGRIKSLRHIFETIGDHIHFSSRLKWKLIGIGSIRFFIFVTQYWLLMFLFFKDFPMFEFYILCGVYFLAQFVIPSMGFLDVGIRANLVIFVFSLYTQNFVQLIAVNYSIWLINLLIPSMFGFYLMRNVMNPFDSKKGLKT
jgi:Lysylphosphatidylglycerol synthase TM region